MKKKHQHETFRLKDQLQELKVEEIRFVARIIGITMPSGAKKDVLCKTLAASLVQEADAVLDGLTVFELRLLVQILDNGGSKRFPPYMENVFSLSRIRIANAGFVDKEGEDGGLDSVITIPDELCFAFTPIIRQILDDKEAYGVEQIEQAAAGLLAIYGVMPLDLLAKQLATLFPDWTEGRLKLNLKRKYLFKVRSPKWDVNTIYAATPFLSDEGMNVYFDRHLFQLPTEYKPMPSKDAIMRFGQMPLPDICTSGAIELRKLYKEAFGEEEGEWQFMDIWMDSQQMQLRDMTERILQELCETEEDITPELVSIIKRFLNHLPNWSMYGYSVKDHALQLSVSEEQANRKIDIAYRSDTGATHEKKSTLSLLDLSADNPYWDGQKIGRNDPCPCGSGLKFKKCHGKN